MGLVWCDGADDGMSINGDMGISRIYKRKYSNRLLTHNFSSRSVSLWVKSNNNKGLSLESWMKGQIQKTVRLDTARFLSLRP